MNDDNAAELLLANQAAALIGCPFVTVIDQYRAQGYASTPLVQIVSHGAHYQSVERFNGLTPEALADRVVKMTAASFHCPRCSEWWKR